MGRQRLQQSDNCQPGRACSMGTEEMYRFGIRVPGADPFRTPPGKIGATVHAGLTAVKMQNLAVFTQRAGMDAAGLEPGFAVIRTSCAHRRMPTRKRREKWGTPSWKDADKRRMGEPRRTDGNPLSLLKNCSFFCRLNEVVQPLSEVCFSHRRRTPRHLSSRRSNSLAWLHAQFASGHLRDKRSCVTTSLR